MQLRIMSMRRLVFMVSNISAVQAALSQNIVTLNVVQLFAF